MSGISMVIPTNAPRAPLPFAIIALPMKAPNQVKITRSISKGKGSGGRTSTQAIPTVEVG